MSMVTRYKKPKKVDFKTLLLYDVMSCNISKMIKIPLGI